VRPGQAYGPARGGPGARVASLISKSRWQQVSGGERRDWELMQQPPARSPAAAACMAAFYLPAGFNHPGFGLVDGRIVKTLTGTDRRGERGLPEARRPSRSSSPPGYWASTRLTASRSSTLRPESPRPEEAKCQVIVAPLPGTQVIPGRDDTLMIRSLTALQTCPRGLLADPAWII
jgi:hypothetical protein